MERVAKGERSLRVLVGITAVAELQSCVQMLMDLAAFALQKHCGDTQVYDAAARRRQ